MHRWDTGWYRLYDPGNHATTLKTILFSICRLREQSLDDILAYLATRPEIGAITKDQVLTALGQMRNEWLIRSSSPESFMAPNAQLKGRVHERLPDVRPTRFERVDTNP
jgi:hypothetical protein